MFIYSGTESGFTIYSLEGSDCQVRFTLILLDSIFYSADSSSFYKETVFEGCWYGWLVVCRKQY